jgi:hypothetical protein
MSIPKAVTLVSGPDSVSAAIGSMQALRRALPSWCDIVLAYSAAPDYVTDRVRAAVGDRPLTIVTSETWQPQPEMRNRALAGMPPYDFYLLLDLDSRIEPGALERCIETHIRTGADMVGGIILYGGSVDYGRSGEKIVHHAGGESRFRPDADGRPGMKQHHEWVGERLADLRAALGSEPWQTEQLEFHGMCMTRRAIELLTPFDSKLLVLEPPDVELRARKHGLKKVIDPMFEVTYEAAGEFLCDLHPYREQWATEAVQDSVRYFAAKYGLPSDGELVTHQTTWNRRHFEDAGAVTRAAFPAPRLTSLFGHPFAQTWPQLLQQLRSQAWTVSEIAGVKRCHDAGRELANGLYHACGKPLMAHLIGTASILAAYGAPPLLVETALVHAGYEQLEITPGEREVGANALGQRVGRNVDRILRDLARQDFSGLAPPDGEEALAFYRLDDARVLLIRVATEIEQHLDGATALTGKRGDAASLLAHARAILPFLGFGALLQAFEAAVALATDLPGSVPDALADQHSQPFRLRERATPDSLALPDEKWIEVASFLRNTARTQDVIAAPHEFRYLCNGIRGEVLRDLPWQDAKREAIIVLHKGRLESQPQAPLAAATSAMPIFANEVFVLFSRAGKPLGAAQRVHLGGLVPAAANISPRRPAPMPAR